MFTQSRWVFKSPRKRARWCNFRAVSIVFATRNQPAVGGALYEPWAIDTPRLKVQLKPITSSPNLRGGVPDEEGEALEKEWVFLKDNDR